MSQDEVDLVFLSQAPKSQLFTYQQPSMKKTPNLPEKIKITEKYKAITHNYDTGGIEEIKSNPIPPGSDPQQNNYNCRDSPKGLRGLISLLGPTAQTQHWGDNPPWENLALKSCIFI